MAQRCVPRHRYGVCLTVHTQPAGNRCKESLQVRLLRRLRGHRIDLPPVDNHRVVARMEAQGAAQVGKADKYGTEAASALRLRPEARGRRPSARAAAPRRDRQDAHSRGRSAGYRGPPFRPSATANSNSPAAGPNAAIPDAGFITWLGFAAAHWRRGDLDQLHEWGLGGRRFGTLITVFPRLWYVCRKHGYKPRGAALVAYRCTTCACNRSPGTRLFRRYRIVGGLQCGYCDTKLPPGLGMIAEEGQTILAGRDRGVPSMCDYSLQYVASRPAKVGDKLVSTKFSNSITGSFAAVGEPNGAVCLLPGTEVAFEKEVECEHTLGFFPNRKHGRKWLGSGKSIRNSRTCITTHSMFPTGRLYCSPASVRVSKRRCCNCRLLRARRRKLRSRSALLSSPNRVRREGA